MFALGAVGLGMLRLIERRQEKVAAQAKLERLLQDAWPRNERREIVWRPAKTERTIHHNGRFWFTSRELKDTTPRFWNAFGKYDQQGSLRISVEINIPTSTNAKAVSGFFAQDNSTGELVLMHDGGVGGGQTGVGRKPFFGWAHPEPVEVVDSSGEVRLGLAVATLADKGAYRTIEAFIETVAAFKAAVSRGETITPQARAVQATYDDYFDEVFGRRRRQAVKELEYVSRHGEIVKALFEWRSARSARAEQVVKNAFIDLGITENGRLRELFEVKTNLRRQTLYAAVGQLMVHRASAGTDCRCYVVVPRGEIASDVTEALAGLGIELLRFDFHKSNVVIVG